MRNQGKQLFSVLPASNLRLPLKQRIFWWKLQLHSFQTSFFFPFFAKQAWGRLFTVLHLKKTQSRLSVRADRCSGLTRPLFNHPPPRSSIIAGQVTGQDVIPPGEMSPLREILPPPLLTCHPTPSDFSVHPWMSTSPSRAQRLCQRSLLAFWAKSMVSSVTRNAYSHPLCWLVDCNQLPTTCLVDSGLKNKCLANEMYQPQGNDWTSMDLRNHWRCIVFGMFCTQQLQKGSVGASVQKLVDGHRPKVSWT